MDYKEKIDNLLEQKKQIVGEISEIEDILLSKEELKSKIDGGIEVLMSLKSEEDKKSKEKSRWFF